MTNKTDRKKKLKSVFYMSDIYQGHEHNFCGCEKCEYDIDRLIDNIIDSGLVGEEPSGDVSVEDDAQEEFHCTSFDAKVWAKEFMRIYREQTQKDIWLDEALMIGWFANAIMAGYDYAKRQSLLPKRLSKEEVLRRFDKDWEVLTHRYVGNQEDKARVKSWLSEILGGE